MDIFRYTDYRDILREELVRRVQQNPNYSQGAFARDISLTPSRLSEILNGKQGISVKVALDIGRALRFDGDQVDFFGDLVESQHGRSRLARESALARLERYRHSRTFAGRMESIKKLLSKWYYLATLELTKLDSFDLTSASLAKALRIEPQQAQDSLSVLTELGLLHEVDGKMLRSSHQNGVSGNLEDRELLKFHSQLLDLSLKKRFSAELQHVHDYLVALDSSKMEYLLRHLKESLEFFVGRADDSPKKDSLYALSVSLFPVCHNGVTNT